MNVTQLPVDIQNKVSEILSLYPPTNNVIHALKKAGATPFLVGGAVRDILLRRDVQDLDIEVFGLEQAAVEQILAELGTVLFVGKQFGVFRIAGLDVDFSLPRRDSGGRKPEVIVDPFLSFHDAAIRRDLTMNAMGIMLPDITLIDPFNGMKDIHSKTLRSPDLHFFIQDPLRLFRVMQFIGRFEMNPDQALNEVCKTMDISTVSCERIEMEFEKLLLQSCRPSLGIFWLKTIGRLQEIMPELYTTIGVAQRPDFHPEGDVFTHSLQSLDASARTCMRDPFTTLIMRYAALCHDVGKPETSRVVDGVIKSPGHAAVGAHKAATLLKRITRNQKLIAAVKKLVYCHMEPLQFIKNEARSAAYKRLALRLAPEVNIEMLSKLFLYDKQGRSPSGYPFSNMFEDVCTFENKARRAKVFEKKEEPILKGADILDRVQAGPAMGRLLEKAYTIQIEEGVTDKEILKNRIFDN